VTCKPAIVLRVLFPMAGEAETHLKVNLLQPIHALHVAVTVHTIKFTPFEMGDMVKKHEIRYPEDLLPGSWRARTKILFFPLDLRMIGNYILVAEKTFLHGRKTRVLRPLHIRVAEATVYTFHACVYPMTEGDRLGVSDTPPVREIQIEREAEEDRERNEPEVARR